MPAKKAFRKKHILIGPPGQREINERFIDRKDVNRHKLASKLDHRKGDELFLKLSKKKSIRDVRNEWNQKEDWNKEIIRESISKNPAKFANYHIKHVIEEADKNIRQIEHRARKAERKLAKKQLELLAPKKVPSDVINAIVKMI